MWIIRRYITREFILYFLTCLLSLVFIAVVFAALAELKSLEKENGHELFLDAILSGIPLLIEIITPISVLLATVLTFISLSRSSEVIAMMAAGVSLVKMVAPILVAGAVIGFLGYLNQSYLAPLWGADERTSMVDSTPKNNSWQFFKGKLYYFSGLQSEKQLVSGSKIIEFNDKHRINRITSLKHLSATDGNWHADERVDIKIDKNKAEQRIKSKTVYAEETFPVVFKKELKHPKYSDFQALITEIKLKRQGAVNYEMDLFALYQKIGSMLSIFVMILLALPFSLYAGKKSNVRLGIVVSVVMGFCFWLIDQILVAFNSAGLLPGVFAAFGANILFTFLAMVLIYSRRV